MHDSRWTLWLIRKPVHGTKRVMESRRCLEGYVGRRAKTNEFDDAFWRRKLVRHFAASPDLGSASAVGDRRNAVSFAGGQGDFEISFQFRRDDFRQPLDVFRTRDLHLHRLDLCFDWRRRYRKSMIEFLDSSEVGGDR